MNHSQQMGEDIRNARFIYEWIHNAEHNTTPVNVSLWLSTAERLRKELRATNLAEVVGKIKEIPSDISEEVK